MLLVFVSTSFDVTLGGAFVSRSRSSRPRRRRICRRQSWRWKPGCTRKKRRRSGGTSRSCRLRSTELGWLQSTWTRSWLAGELVELQRFRWKFCSNQSSPRSLTHQLSEDPDPLSSVWSAAADWRVGSNQSSDTAPLRNRSALNPGPQTGLLSVGPAQMSSPSWCPHITARMSVLVQEHTHSFLLVVCSHMML